MSTIYVDESAGSDETGKGTAEQPYQTLAFAIYAHSTDTLLIRKDPTGTYEEPTQSSLKKAKKGADGLEKKRKKAEELAEREAKEKSEERERRERLLEESKKIVLEEDPALPKATKVGDPSFWRLSDHSSEIQSKIKSLEPLRGQRVRVSGWIHRLRDQKGIIFVVLRDGTGYLQCVLSGQVVRSAIRNSLHHGLNIVYRLKPTMRLR